MTRALIALAAAALALTLGLTTLAATAGAAAITYGNGAVGDAVDPSLLPADGPRLWAGAEQQRAELCPALPSLLLAAHIGADTGWNAATTTEEYLGEAIAALCTRTAEVAAWKLEHPDDRRDEDVLASGCVTAGTCAPLLDHPEPAPAPGCDTRCAADLREHLDLVASLMRAYQAQPDYGSCAGLGGAADHTMAVLADKGFTPQAAAGIVGNLMQESRIDPRTRRAGGPGRGIMQWTEGERWQTLLRWAASRNQDPWDLDTQLGYLLHQMKARGILDGYRRITDVRQATATFQAQMNQAGQPTLDKRIAYAQTALEATTCTTAIGAGDGTCASAGMTRKPPRPDCAAVLRWIQAATRGTCTWHNLCQMFTAHAWGHGGSCTPAAMLPEGCSAWGVWQQLNRKGIAHPGDRNPPIGAMVYWKGRPIWGHAAVYIGGGKVASTDIRRHGCVDIVPLTAIEREWNQTYLGWAPPALPA